MNEYYNYAENNYAGNAEQCGNVPPVNVYGRADGQFVQPQRQLQGPPEAKKVYGIRDFIFAVMTVIIGFITLKLFFTEGEIFPFAEVIVSGWYHVIVATLAVMAVIYIGKKPTASQWAIFGCVILFCAVPVFSSTGLVRFLSWVYAAILLCYFAYSFITAKPLFSDGFFREICEAVFAVPFANFSAAPKCVAVPFINKEKGEKSKTALYILLGVLCSIPAVIIACTALSSADDNFRRLLSGITGGFFDNFFTNVIILAVSIPLSFLLFGAMSGAKGRKRKMTGDTGRAAKVPAVAICSALTPLILIYLLFFACQLPYYLSAFGGVLPDGYSYSGYARQGFFELCGVAVLDLLVIFLAGVLAKRNENGRKPVAVRIYSAVFSLITILLICSAMSKMIMYIGEYGLTGLRFYTSWFMILLGIVFLVLILHEIFPGMKTVATLFISFTVMFSALCFCDPDARIAQYNVESYLSGEIAETDTGSLAMLSEGAAPYVERLKDSDSAYYNCCNRVLITMKESRTSGVYFPLSFTSLKANVIYDRI